MLSAKLIDIMENKIRIYLTNGLIEQGVSAYTLDQQDWFLADNYPSLENAIFEMIQEYMDENDLSSLDNPDDDIIYEYIHEYITLPTKDDPEDTWMRDVYMEALGLN